VLRPLAFYSTKLKGAELRYPTHEKELFAIIKSLKKCRSYIYGRPINVQTEHRTMQYFITQPKLSLRQARWAELMAIIIEYWLSSRQNECDCGLPQSTNRLERFQETQGKEENELCREIIELVPEACEETCERINSCQLNDERCKKLQENKSLLADQN